MSLSLESVEGDPAARGTAGVVRIGDVELGGRPGERPPVMVGSIFYQGDPLVRDPLVGSFDATAARNLLDQEAELAAETGLPRFVDVIGDTPRALISFVEFVARHTDVPILVDSGSVEAKLETFRYFRGSEVFSRLVYDSIDQNAGERELEAIAELGVSSAVVQVFGARAVRPADKVKALLGPGGLLERVQVAGVKNVLVDVGCLDVPSTAWSARAIREVKQATGLPAGCAPCNGFYSWATSRGLSRDLTIVTGSAVLTYPLFAGADFLFYGPLESASWAYPACAVAAALVAYGARLDGVRPVSKAHPLYRAM